MWRFSLLLLYIFIHTYSQSYFRWERYSWSPYIWPVSLGQFSKILPWQRQTVVHINETSYTLEPAVVKNDQSGLRRSFLSDGFTTGIWVWDQRGFSHSCQSEHLITFRSMNHLFLRTISAFDSTNDRWFTSERDIRNPTHWSDRKHTHTHSLTHRSD